MTLTQDRSAEIANQIADVADMERHNQGFRRYVYEAALAVTMQALTVAREEGERKGRLVGLRSAYALAIDVSVVAAVHINEEIRALAAKEKPL